MSSIVEKGIRGGICHAVYRYEEASKTKKLVKLYMGGLVLNGLYKHLSSS